MHKNPPMLLDPPIPSPRNICRDLGQGPPSQLPFLGFSRPKTFLVRFGRPTSCPPGPRSRAAWDQNLQYAAAFSAMGTTTPGMVLVVARSGTGGGCTTFSRSVQ